MRSELYYFFCVFIIIFYFRRWLRWLQRSLICQRPYCDENTGSLPNSEVKHRKARIVLGWVTAREVLRVLLAFSITYFFTDINGALCDVWAQGSSSIDSLADINVTRADINAATAFIRCRNFVYGINANFFSDINATFEAVFFCHNSKEFHLISNLHLISDISHTKRING